MKAFRIFSILLALFAVSVTVTGCQSDGMSSSSSSGSSGGSGSGGY